MTLTFVVGDETDERLLRLKGQEVLAIQTLAWSEVLACKL